MHFLYRCSQIEIHRSVRAARLSTKKKKKHPKPSTSRDVTIRRRSDASQTHLFFPFSKAGYPSRRVGVAGRVLDVFFLRGYDGMTRRKPRCARHGNTCNGAPPPLPTLPTRPGISARGVSPGFLDLAQNDRFAMTRMAGVKLLDPILIH